MMNAGNLKGKTRQTSDWRRRIIAFVSALTLLISSCGLTAFAESDEDIYSNPVTAPIPAANTSPEPEEGEAQATPAPEGQPEEGTEPQEAAVEGTEPEGEPEVSEEPEDLTVYEAGTLIAEADGVGITVDYTAEARVPEGTVLTLTRAAGGDLYSALKSASKVLKTEEDATWKRELGEDAVFYAITLTDSEGNEIHPETGVTLTCTNLEIPADATGFVTGENAENLDWKDTLTVGFLPDAIGYAYLKQVQIGTVTLTHEDRDYMVTAAYGPDAGFPADTELKVREILPGTPEYALYSGMTDEALNEDWAEITLERYFDIAFVANGEELEPKADVDVQIVFRDKIEQNEETEVAAVHIENNEANVIEADTDSTKSARHDDEAIDTVTFTSDSFSVYGVVQKKKIITKVLAADGNTYEIEISYTQEAEIPEESQVKVEEIPEGSDLWEAYRKQTAAALNADDVRLPGLYDISIIDAEGAKIEPKAPVSVSIKLANAEANNEDLHVVHFTEEIPQELVEAEAKSEEQTEVQPIAEEDKIESEKISASVEGDTVTFDTQAFSVYAFAYKIVTYYKTATGETYKITLNYDENSGVPEGSTLNVEEILPGDSRYNEYLKKALKATAQKDESAEITKTEDITDGEETASAEETISETVNELTVPDDQYARFFDIEIQSNDRKVEPDGNVQVTIELADVPEDKLDEMAVVHFAANGMEIIDAEITAGSIRFDAESFSVYGILTYFSSQPQGDAYDLAGREFKMQHNGQYVMAEVLLRTTDLFRKQNNQGAATVWEFEATDQDGAYYIFTKGTDGSKRYMNLNKLDDNRARAALSSEPQAFTINKVASNTYKYTLGTVSNGKTYYLNEFRGAEGFAGWYQRSSNDDEMTLEFENSSAISNGKKCMVLVEYNGKYYIVNNDACLTEVEYDPVNKTVKTENPMMWTYEDNHLYYNFEAIGFVEDKRASDFYRRYLNPGSDDALTTETFADVDCDANWSDQWASHAPWYDSDTNTWQIPYKVKAGGRRLWDNVRFGQWGGHVWHGNYTDNRYFGVETDENGVPIRLVGNQDGSNAATILFADATAVPDSGAWNHMVDHIDISISGKSKVNVPLAYGTYYYQDSSGNWQQYDVTSYTSLNLEMKDVNISPDDMRGATIKAYSGNKELDNAFKITGYSSNAHTNISTVQVRIEGSFKVADLNYGGNNDYVKSERLKHPITYVVSAIKNLDFEMVDPSRGQLYEKQADGTYKKLVVNLDVDMTASFNYFDQNNECPPIQKDWGNGDNYRDWLKGGIPDGSGMDFVLGGDAEAADANVVALEITKQIVDESGKLIHPKQSIVNSMEVYARYGANEDSTVANSVSGLNVGRYNTDASYADYELIHGKDISVGTSGMGLVYDYAVKPGMYYIVEKNDDVSLPKSFIDTAGNTWIYKETYITTEYVRRGDAFDSYANPMHYSKTYSAVAETYRSIPEVLGLFTPLSGEVKKSGILEFFVYNVYVCEDKTSLEVEKSWADGNIPENSEVTFELYFAKRQTTENGTPITPADWPSFDTYTKVKDNNESIFDPKLNTTLTLKANEAESINWKGIFTNLPKTWKDSNDNDWEIDYFAQETSIIIDGEDVTALYNKEAVKTQPENDAADSDGKVTITNTEQSVEVKLRKVDANNISTQLQGAKFKIYTAEAYLNNGKPITDTTYTIYDTNMGSPETDKDGETVFVSGENGNFYHGLLPVGTYYLVEVDAPQDYQMLTGPVRIEIKGSRKEVGYQGVDVIYDDGQTATLKMTSQTKEGITTYFYNVYIKNVQAEKASLTIKKEWVGGNDRSEVKVTLQRFKKGAGDSEGSGETGNGGESGESGGSSGGDHSDDDPPAPKNNGSLTIVKAGVPSGSSGFAATYSVSGPNGYSQTIQFTSNNSQTLTGLVAGTYTVSENVTGSVSGYTMNSTSTSSQEAQVADDTTQTVTFTGSYTQVPATGETATVILYVNDSIQTDTNSNVGISLTVAKNSTIYLSCSTFILNQYNQWNPECLLMRWDATSNPNWHHWENVTSLGSAPFTNKEITIGNEDYYCVLIKHNAVQKDIGTYSLSTNNSSNQTQRQVRYIALGGASSGGSSSVTIPDNYIEDPGFTQEITLNSGNEWTYTLDVPQKDAAGNAYYYKIVETNTPSDYEVSYTNQIVKADTAATMLMIATNTYKKGKISVTKVDVKDETDASMSVDNTFTFIIKNAEGNQVGEALSVKKGETATSDWLPLGTYTVEEKSEGRGVSGYEFSRVEFDLDSVTLTNTDTVSVSATNYYSRKHRPEDIPASVTFNKVDQNNAPLEGATFKLYDNDDLEGDSIYTYTDQNFTISTDDEFISPLLSSNDNVVLYLKETEAPDKHDLNDHTYIIVITKTVSGPTLTGDEYVTTTTYSISVDGETASDEGINVVNPPASIELSVDKKWFQGEEEISGEYYLSNAAITVKVEQSTDDGENWTTAKDIEGNDIEDVVITKHDNWYKKWKLPKYDGDELNEIKYRIVETEAKINSTDELDLTNMEPIPFDEEGKAEIHNPLPTTSIEVTKAWSYDETDEWPENVQSVVVGLYSNNEPVKDPQDETKDYTISISGETQEAAFTGIPEFDVYGERIEYTVKELSIIPMSGDPIPVSANAFFLNNRKWIVSVTDPDSNGEATITNTKEGTGSLVVTKSIEGDASDPTLRYHFTVTQLSEPTITGTYGEMTFTEGVATFELGHNERIQADELPNGFTYTVTETEANTDGYYTTSTILTSFEDEDEADYSIRIGETETVNYVNGKSNHTSIRVTKEWIDVLPGDLQYYPEVSFTLYQSTADKDYFDVNAVYRPGGEDDDSFVNIKLNNTNGWTWNCPVDLPATEEGTGKEYRYYVVETQENGQPGIGEIIQTNPALADTVKAKINGYYASPVVGSGNWGSYYKYDQPWKAYIGNRGEILIQNKAPDYMQMDIKKKFLRYDENGSLWTDTGDAARVGHDLVIEVQILRRIVKAHAPMNASGNDIVVDWSPYANPIMVGYGMSMQDPLCKNDNPFNIDYQGAWHWRITCQDQNNGLPGYGFYDGQYVRYQYIHKEIGAYKDLNRTPLDDGYEWIGDMPYAWDGDNSNTGVGKQFKVNEPAIAQDQDRLLNIGATNLKIEKKWTGYPSAFEVYVKVYRITGQNYDPSKRVDYTNILGREVNTLTHAKDGELIGEFVRDDNGEKYIKVPAGTTVTIEHVLMTISQSEPLYYWVEECGYKDLSGTVHWNSADENVMEQFTPVYSINGSATNDTLNNNNNRTGSDVIRLGPKNSNLFTITNTTTVIPGSLKLSKTVDLSDGKEILDKVFYFTVFRDGKYYYLNSDGELVISENTAQLTGLNDPRLIAVTSNGEPVTIDGLLPGEYIVTEYTADDNSVLAITDYTYSSTDLNETQGITYIEVTVEDEEAVSVAALNHYNRDTGSLYIEKTVTVNGEEVTDENRGQVDGNYSFTITSDETFTTVVDGEDPVTTPAVTRSVTITIDGGVVTGVDGATLVDGKALVTDLPTGDYTVTENLTEDQINAGITFTATGNEHVTVTADTETPIPTASFVNNINRIRIPVDKVWVFADLSGIESEQISEENVALWPKNVTVTVTLYQKIGDAEPEATEQTLILSKDQMSGAFVNLPVKSGEDDIIYSVVETDITGIDGSKIWSSITGDAENGFTITNTEKEATLTIIKSIVDNASLLTDTQKNNITFTVTGEGLPEDGLTRTYSELTNETWTLTQADGIKAGVTYTVTEKNADFEGITRTTEMVANENEITPTETTVNEATIVSGEVEVVVDPENENSASGTITITNKYERTLGKVQVTKVFNGLPDSTTYPADFKITAVWEGQESVELSSGTLPTVEGLTINMDGTGTEDDPYIWTIDGLPTGTEVTFTEEGYSVAGYNWTGTVNGEQGTSGKAEAVKVEENEELPDKAKVDFVNSYVAGVELPATGGSGTMIYTITGIFLITLAGTLLVSRKRKNEQ